MLGMMNLKNMGNVRKKNAKDPGLWTNYTYDQKNIKSYWVLKFYVVRASNFQKKCTLAWHILVWQK